MNEVLREMSAEHPLPVREALISCVEALTMILHGVDHAYGAPPEFAGGCSEAEALSACHLALAVARDSLAADRD